MSIYFRLNKEINTRELLKKLQDEINNHGKDNNLEESVLYIEIKNTAHVIEDMARAKALAYLENNNVENS